MPCPSSDSTSKMWLTPDLVLRKGVQAAPGGTFAPDGHIQTCCCLGNSICRKLLLFRPRLTRQQWLILDARRGRRRRRRRRLTPFHAFAGSGLAETRDPTRDHVLAAWSEKRNPTTASQCTAIINTFSYSPAAHVCLLPAAASSLTFLFSRLNMPSRGDRFLGTEFPAQWITSTSQTE